MVASRTRALINPIKRFEFFVVQPLWVVVVAETIAAGFYHMWLWTLAGMVGVLFVGFIGARVHPSLSASQLREGPTKGEPAIREMATMTRHEMLVAITAACGRLVLLLTFLVSANLAVFTPWRWYVVVPVAWCIASLIAMAINAIFALGNIRA